MTIQLILSSMRNTIILPILLFCTCFTIAIQHFEFSALKNTLCQIPEVCSLLIASVLLNNYYQVTMYISIVLKYFGIKQRYPANNTYTFFILNLFDIISWIIYFILTGNTRLLYVLSLEIHIILAFISLYDPKLFRRFYITNSRSLYRLFRNLFITVNCVVKMYIVTMWLLK